MTIATTVNRVVAQGNGATTAFSYSFLLPAAANAVVTVTDSSGNQIVLVPTQYSLSGLGSGNGGTLNYPLSGSPLPAGSSITLQRVLPLQQLTSLINQGGYFPNVVEGALDNLEMQIQQLAGIVGGNVSVQFPPVDPLTLNSILPAAAARANKLFSFDALGNVAAIAPAAQSATALAISLLTSAGAAMVGFIQAGAGAILRLIQDKLRERVSVADFGVVGIGGDDTAVFQLAVATHKSLYVPQGTYNITTVNIDVYGCDIRFDKEAVINVTGGGFKRNLTQSPRATFIASNSLLDATNYYYSLKTNGGTFNVAANATAISDRVPFLVNTGASPSQVLLQRTPLITDANITLAATTSVGVGFYGGWGGTLQGGSIQAAGIAGVAIDIGASNAGGDTHCMPQELTISNVTFNSCQPFRSALNGCTNSCEALAIVGCNFNFILQSQLIGVNSLRYVGDNVLVTDFGSLDIVDSGDVTFNDFYLESDHDPANAAKPGVVNFQNCSNLKVANGSVFALATAVATARAGIFIAADSANQMQGVILENIRGVHATRDAAIETNLIQFATGGGTGQIVDIVCKNIVANDWHNAVNFTDHITTLATRVDLETISNSNGVRFVKGLARIATNSLRAPGLWEQFSMVLSGQSIGGGSATVVLAGFWPTVMKSAAPVVTVSNFVNIANCNGITAAWATIGANTVHITGAQTAASAQDALVQGSATITVDGTAV